MRTSVLATNAAWGATSATVDAAGTFHVLSALLGYDAHLEHFWRTATGWSQERIAEGAIERPFIVAGSHGRLDVVYRDDAGNHLRRRGDDGWSEEPLPIPSEEWVKGLEADPTGALHVLAVREGPSFSYYTDRSDQWTATPLIFDGRCGAGTRDVAFAVSASGEVHLAVECYLGIGYAKLGDGPMAVERVTRNVQYVYEDTAPAIVLDPAERPLIGFARSGSIRLARKSGDRWLSEQVAPFGEFVGVQLQGDRESIHALYLGTAFGERGPGSGVWHAERSWAAPGAWQRHKVGVADTPVPYIGPPAVLAVSVDGTAHIALVVAPGIVIRGAGLVHATNDGDGWTTERFAASRAASVRSIGVDREGHAHVVVVHASGPMTLATDASGAWIESELAHSPPDGFVPLVVEPDGTSHVAFASRTRPGIEYASQRGSGPLVPRQVTADPDDISPALAVDGDGQPHLAFWRLGTGLMYATRDASGWRVTLAVHDVTRRQFGSSIRPDLSLGLDGAGRAHVAWIPHWAPFPGVFVATDLTGAWTKARVTHGVDQSAVDIVVDHRGKTDLVIVVDPDFSGGDRPGRLLHATDRRGGWHLERVPSTAGNWYGSLVSGRDAGGRYEAFATRGRRAGPEVLKLVRTDGQWRITSVAKVAWEQQVVIGLDPSGRAVLAVSDDSVVEVRLP